MSKLADLTGKKFGKWTVLERGPDKPRTDPRKSGLTQWLCQCECGKKQLVLAMHLVKGASSKCKDCKYEGMQLNGKMSSRYYHRIKWNAKKRGIAVSDSLTREYLDELYRKQKGLCALSGMSIAFADTLSSDHTGSTTASIDRIDSSKGYVPGNLQWVHKDINKMKLNLDQDKFVELCKKVSNHQV